MVRTKSLTRILALACLNSISLLCEVITDGSLGLAQTINAASSNYDIRADIGTSRGGNQIGRAHV